MKPPSLLATIIVSTVVKSMNQNRDSVNLTKGRKGKDAETFQKFETTVLQ